MSYNTMKKEQGFTLLEALMAMTVLTIGVLALFAMVMSTISGNAVANGLTEASTLGQDRVEQVLSWNYNDSRLDDDDDTPIPGSAVPADASVVQGVYTVYWNVEPVNDASGTELGKTVDVEVHWTEMGKSRKVRFQVKKQRSS